jgi:hypothetical protein
MAVHTVVAAAQRVEPPPDSHANQKAVNCVANTHVCGVSKTWAARENSRMNRKPDPFTWDDEPAEKTTTFQSSTQSINSSWQDAAVASRLAARRAAARRGILKLAGLVLALLGVSGLLLYEISKRV